MTRNLYIARRAAMVLTIDYRETIANRVQSDPSFSRALLDEADTMLISGETEAARLLMRDLSHEPKGLQKPSPRAVREW
jgi:hypothetical protein